MGAFAGMVLDSADASMVADAIPDVVDIPFVTRPFRIRVNFAEDGIAVGFAVLDRVRAEMLRRLGLADLLGPRFVA